MAFARSILSSLSATIAIASATRSMSSVLKPRVVHAGVPRRTPLVTNGDLGSRGTVFLFAVMLARSSVHGVSKARILEWVAFSFSRESSRPRDQTQISHIAGRFFTI